MWLQATYEVELWRMRPPSTPLVTTDTHMTMKPLHSNAGAGQALSSQASGQCFGPHQSDRHGRYEGKESLYRY